MLPKVSSHPVTVVQESVAKLHHIVRDTKDFSTTLIAQQHLDALCAGLWHSTTSQQYKASLPYIGLHVTLVYTHDGLQTYIGSDIARWIEFCLLHRDYKEIHSRLFGQFTIAVTKGMAVVFPDLYGMSIVTVCVLERNLITAVQMHLLGMDMSYEIAHIRKFLQTEYRADGHSSLLLNYDLSHTNMQIVTNKQLTHGAHIVSPFLIIRALADLAAHKQTV